MMGRKSFTLMESIITLIVIGILAMVGTTGAVSIINKSKRMICEQNQVIIMKALKMYIYKNGSVPSQLTSLYPEYTDTAIAQLKKDEPERLKMRSICLALIKLSRVKEALAQSNFDDFVGDPGVLKCPCGSNGGISYAFNSSLLVGSDPWDQFETLENADSPIICDCDNATFAGLGGASYRHERLGGADLAIFVGGESIKTISQDNQNWNNPYYEKKIKR